MVSNPKLPKGTTMFESFNADARRVVVLAAREAHRLNHHYIGTEHLLLGLTLGDDTTAARELTSRGITYEACREQVLEIIGLGQESRSLEQLPFTPRGKKVLELSLREALALEDRYINTGHILLGLLRQDEGSVAIHVLKNLGISIDGIRDKVIIDMPKSQVRQAMELNFSALGLGERLSKLRALRELVGEDDAEYKKALARLLETAARRIRKMVADSGQS
jgi:ATP-dependent Clp protease ATP-binding subunit ClpC